MIRTIRQDVVHARGIRRKPLHQDRASGKRGSWVKQRRAAASRYSAHQLLVSSVFAQPEDLEELMAERLSLAPGARIQSQAEFPHFQEVGRFGSTTKRQGQPTPLYDADARSLPTENVIVFRWAHAPMHYARAGVNYDHLHRAGCRGLLKIRLLQKADLHLVSLGGKCSSNPIRN
jgi:hypothetical protein